MGKSYRIRTTPGDDKNINVKIEQDFEILEILSLKIRQQDVYTRMCSDYGVIAGRVFSNRGYGIPNAKISIFIPILEEDEENPIINSIYPYKNLEQVNEDGYKYNLLPYAPQYNGHASTGTFPTRLDALINETVVELYDKYYKFTVTTNDSGDFLIFGVPVGTQTLVMNLDLSDMGPFSLTPQDLIRMGLATESQFDGVKFKSSVNFESLPQIIRIARTIEVVPFWGEEDTCQIGITRSDFDLTSEANLNIQPVAVFMGSHMSSVEKTGIKPNNRARKTTGELCKMIAGPGEIIAISQTIFRDSQGLPILRVADLPNGGKLIDGDGTWIFDLPMNLDYVFTNEFGDKVLSNDPTIGVPTKAKYRFKIKWQQSRNLNEDYKRAYFLVPNIKERGWDLNNPNADPLSGALGPNSYLEAQKSYAFSLDWSAYTNNLVSLRNTDILSAINCDDYFYEFDYNRVYTVSQLIDYDKRRKNRKRFIGVKKIEDDACDGNYNRYPSNDGVYYPTIMYVIFMILTGILAFLLIPILIVYHIVMFIRKLIFDIVCGICRIPVVRKLCSQSTRDDCKEGWEEKPLRLPMITYPDCETCEGTEADQTAPSSTQATQVDNPNGIYEVFPSFNYVENPTSSDDGGPKDYYSINDSNIRDKLNYKNSSTSSFDPVIFRQIKGESFENNYRIGDIQTRDLNFGERINAFNTKGKYYSDNGSVNLATVKIEPSLNPNNHTDNLLVFLIDSTYNDFLPEGSTFTMINTNTFPDVNVTNNITGTTTNPTSITLSYALSSAKVGNQTITYQLPPSTSDTTTYKFASDVEYYQVIKSMKYTDFTSASRKFPSEGTFASILKGHFVIDATSSIYPDIIANFENILEINNLTVLFVQRGVDIYSPLFNIDFGLGRYFGFDDPNAVIHQGRFKINVPIQNNLNNNDELTIIHNQITNNSTQFSGRYLFHKSNFFKPGSNFTPYITGNIKYYSKIDSTTVPVTVRAATPINNVDDLIPENNQLIYNQTIPQDNVPFFLNAQAFELSVYKQLSTTPELIVSNPIVRLTPTRQTSGALISGRKYIIVDYNAGDNFINGGASSNSVNTVFTYNGGPITWTNNSRLSQLVSFQNFLTPANVPDRALIPAGTWTIWFKGGSQNGTDAKFLFEILKIDGSNNEVSLGLPIVIKDVDNIEYYRHQVNLPIISLSPTDRILIKVYAANPLLGDKNVNFYPQSDTDTCFIQIPFPRMDAKYSNNESLGGGTLMDSNGNNDFNYFSDIYTPFNVTISDPERIIIRSDSLPSSDSYYREPAPYIGSTSVKYFGDDFIFQQNPVGNFYVTNAKQVTSYNPYSVGASQGNTDFDDEFSGDTSGFEQNVLNSFSCENMVALKCYQGSGLNFTVIPNCADTDHVENGLYVFVRRPLKDLKDDLKNLEEYTKRFRFNLALCQNILALSFFNNWINGNLYAFPIKINTYYNRFNRVKRRKFANKLVVLHDESNNFYYRSSPFATNRFIGAPAVSQRQIDNGANVRNLKNPTTILNMGPVQSFLSEISLSKDFRGYYMDQVSSTSYQDTDDLINYLGITRLVQSDFFSRNAVRLIRGLFSRKGDKVDGDFAQMDAINSQLGVINFDAEFYSSAPPNPNVILASAGGQNGAVMGIYFDSSNEDIQIRDFVSPRRDIFYNRFTNSFVYESIPTKSQVVPHYKWYIQPQGQSLFGTQYNDWATNFPDILQNVRYQQLDRLNNNGSQYPIGNYVTDYDKRGYLFSINASPQLFTQGPLVVNNFYIIIQHNIGDDFTQAGAPNNNVGTRFQYNGGLLIWNNESVLQYPGDYEETRYTSPNPSNGGAPWYFYFGLIKGKSAMNRFYEKYVGITIDE